MVAQAFCGWEGELGASSAVPATSGASKAGTASALTIDTTIKRTGRSSGKVVAVSGQSSTFVPSNGSVAGGWMGAPGMGYCRVYVRVTVRPTTTARVLIGIIGTGTSCCIKLNPNGTLAYFAPGPSGSPASQLVGTSSVALTDTTKWYRVEWTGTGIPNNSSFKAVMRIDGVDQVSTNPDPGFWGWDSSFGPADTVADTYTAYFDDFARDGPSPGGVWPADGGCVLLLPVADNARTGNWVTGAGGTTNLWDAVNNQPPTGAVSPGTATSQIKHTGGAATTTSDNYDAKCQNYDLYLPTSGITAKMIWAGIITGEDIGTGDKQISWKIASNPTDNAVAGVPSNFYIASASNPVGAFPTNWLSQATFDQEAAINPITWTSFPVIRVTRPETASRTGCVCFMGVYLDAAYSSGPTYSSTLTGSEPNPTGTLTRSKTKAPVGSEPNPTGALARIKAFAPRTLAGAESASTGTLNGYKALIQVITFAGVVNEWLEIFGPGGVAPGDLGVTTLPFTFMALVRPLNNGQAWNGIFQNGNGPGGGGGTGFWVGRNNNNNRLAINMGTVNSDSGAIATVTLTDNQWQLVAVVSRSTSAQSYYVYNFDTATWQDQQRGGMTPVAPVGRASIGNYLGGTGLDEFSEWYKGDMAWLGLWPLDMSNSGSSIPSDILAIVNNGPWNSIWSASFFMSFDTSALLDEAS